MVARSSTTSALVFAAGMAFLAGATDAYGFVLLRGLYVSFMSGNTTMLGMSLGSGGFARPAGIILLIGLFVVGAAAGEVLLNVAGRFRAAAVLFAVSLLLCGPLIVPSWKAFTLVSAMGALNAAMSRVGSANVSLTYVTGALVKFGQGAGNWLTGQRADLSWLLQAPIWASLLAGSVASAMLQQVGVERPWPLPVVGLLLAICAIWQRSAHPSHPDQTALSRKLSN
jgi:uncharacterized membrane protein YoaK (UPF0700 family)